VTKETSCQRPDCDQPGKLRTMTDPADGKKLELRLCDQDYKTAQADEQPPPWLRELLTHIGLVG
jgi:hypothetical protein